MHPVSRQIAKLHVLEEARHVSFAKTYLAEVWPTLADDERDGVQRLAPVAVDDRRRPHGRPRRSTRRSASRAATRPPAPTRTTGPASSRASPSSRLPHRARRDRRLRPRPSGASSAWSPDGSHNDVMIGRVRRHCSASTSPARSRSSPGRRRASAGRWSQGSPRPAPRSSSSSRKQDLCDAGRGGDRGRDRARRVRARLPRRRLGRDPRLRRRGASSGSAASTCSSTTPGSTRRAIGPSRHDPRLSGARCSR